MGSFRAKDADRDRFVEVIEAAYVDGQIGDADRDLRVGRALAAETLDELRTLTRDLQPPDGAATPAPVPRRAVAAPASQRSRRAAGVVVSLVAFLVLVAAGVTAVVALAFFAGSGDPLTTTTIGSDRAEPPPEVVVDTTPTAPSFAMTVPEVRTFLRAYERKFGTLDAYGVGFYPERVGVQVPVRGPRPRMERWSWTGSWKQDTEASRVVGPDEIVDLGTVDVRRMFANIAAARKVLRVQKGRLTHVLVTRWSDEPASVDIYIANTFDESGYLETSPAGDVLRAFPYDA